MRRGHGDGDGPCSQRSRQDGGKHGPAQQRPLADAIMLLLSRRAAVRPPQMKDRRGNWPQAGAALKVPSGFAAVLCSPSPIRSGIRGRSGLCGLHPPRSLLRRQGHLAADLPVCPLGRGDGGEHDDHGRYPRQGGNPDVGLLCRVLHHAGHVSRRKSTEEA
jgi:hypothetical protein